MITDEELDALAARAGARRETGAGRTNDDIWDAVRARGARAAPGARSDARRLSRAAWIVGALAAAIVVLVGGIVIGAQWEKRRGADATARETAQIIRSHLQESAAVIDAFRYAVATGAPNGELGPWARRLETVTRQIQTTRAAHDSTLGDLLGDLDYVLAQIATYGDVRTNRVAESELIESSLVGRQVVARIQSVSASEARRADAHGGIFP